MRSGTISIPAELQKRIRIAAKEDDDLLQEQLASAKAQCLRRHCQRVWQRLKSDERSQLKEQNPGRTEFPILAAIGAFLESDATGNEPFCYEDSMLDSMYCMFGVLDSIRPDVSLIERGDDFANSSIAAFSNF